MKLQAAATEKKYLNKFLLITDCSSESVLTVCCSHYNKLSTHSHCGFHYISSTM